MKRIFPLALLLCSHCFSFQERPWFGNAFEFYFRPQYSYSFFKDVDQSVAPLPSTFSQHLFNFNLELTTFENWNWQVEIDFADTSSVSLGYRSFAFQMTRLWLSDVCGDLVSLATGVSYRDASCRLRRALSTPFHARANFEVYTSIGKEWSYHHDWTLCTYGVFAVGQGSKGSPWLLGDLAIWWNFFDRHQLRLYSKSYFGLGNQILVPIADFQGWANLAHQSIDLGGSYRYQLNCWGSFRLDYRHRVYAKSYPEHVHFFMLTYDLPFCPF